jgi:hypothetical protein
MAQGNPQNLNEFRVMTTSMEKVVPYAPVHMHIQTDARIYYATRIPVILSGCAKMRPLYSLTFVDVAGILLLQFSRPASLLLSVFCVSLRLISPSLFFSVNQIVNRIQSRKQSRKLGRYKMSSVYRIQVA